MSDKTYEAWVQKQGKLVSDDWDNVSLYTGEEGSGKSSSMLRVCRHLDPTFNIDRVHFEQEDFLAQAGKLPSGAAIMLDEFRGHRRAAMHGDRLVFLDFLKEVRGLNLHMAIGFPHVTQLDRDILRSRVRNWIHHPQRGVMHIRERVASVQVDYGGSDPTVLVRWPSYGKFGVGKLSGPLYDSYGVKKKAFMARKRGDVEEPQKRLFNPDPAVLAEFLAAKLPRKEPVRPLGGLLSGDSKLLDIVQAELGRVG